MARALARDVARFVILLGEFDAAEGWRASGSLACWQWLALRCGMSVKTAREQVRVARALRSLPAITAAFSSGELSYSKVRALTRMATATSDAVMVSIGTRNTASQLDAMARGHRLASADADPARRDRLRGLYSYFDEDGMMVVVARLRPEDGQRCMTKVDEVAATLSTDSPAGESDETEEYPSPRARARADAFVALVADGGSAGARRDERRPLVVVHAGNGERLEGGPPIARSTAQRLGCDGSALAVVDHKCGMTHSVGRTTRVVPRGMRRRLWLRDGGCRFPGCFATSADAHHIRHWLDGGETSMDNLVLLCRRHHRYVHELGFRIEKAPEGLCFRRPDGLSVTGPPEETRAS